MQDLEQTVRERAYHMWMDAGCPQGRADAFWLCAQREVLATSLGSIAHVTVTNTAATKKVTRNSKMSKKRRAA